MIIVHLIAAKNILQNPKANGLEDEKKVLLFQRTLDSLKLINKNHQIIAF